MSQSLSYRPEQGSTIMDEDVERSTDMHITGAREDVTALCKPIHQPVDQDTHFTSTQRESCFSGTGMVSYPMSSTSASVGHKHPDIESGSSSFDWLSNYQRPTADDSILYSSSALSNYARGGDGRFNAPNERDDDMQSIPGLGDCDHPVPDKSAASTESSRPKHNIFLHFGLEEEDLEYLLSFPEDQITVANLPLFLHQIRIQQAKRATTAVQPKPDPEPSQEPLPKNTTEVKNSAFGSSREQVSSVTRLSSLCSSVLNSVAPASNDQTKCLQTQPNQAPQTILTSFTLPKKDTDVRVVMSEASKPVPLKEPEADCQMLKTQPPCTLFHGSNDNSGTKDQSKTQSQGSTVAEQMKNQQTQQPMEQQSKQQLAPLVSSITDALQAMSRPMFITGDPRPTFIPPAPPQPIPGLMSFNHMTLLTSNQQPPTNVAVSNSLGVLAMKHEYAAASARIFPNKDYTHVKNQKTKHGSCSRSHLCSPCHHHHSERRKEKRSSRLRSPHSSRYTRRSWSHSPPRDRPTSSHYRSRSRSPERRSSQRRRDEKWSSPWRNDERRSSPRRSSERRSPPRRSDERQSPLRRSHERQSSTEGSSLSRNNLKNVELLAKTLLQMPAVQSLPKQSDVETVVRTVAHALLSKIQFTSSSKAVSCPPSSPASSSSTSMTEESTTTTSKAKPSFQSEASSSTKTNGQQTGHHLRLGALNENPLPSTSDLPATPSTVPSSSYIPSSQTQPASSKVNTGGSGWASNRFPAAVTAIQLATPIQPPSMPQTPTLTPTPMPPLCQPKKNLSLTRDQMYAAREMFEAANKVTRAEKAFILSFMAGSRENPCPEQGDIFQIELSEHIVLMPTADGTGSTATLVSTVFEMNYATGQWTHLRKYKPITNAS